MIDISKSPSWWRSIPVGRNRRTFCESFRDWWRNLLWAMAGIQAFLQRVHHLQPSPGKRHSRYTKYKRRKEKRRKKKHPQFMDRLGWGWKNIADQMSIEKNAEEDSPVMLIESSYRDPYTCVYEKATPKDKSPREKGGGRNMRLIASFPGCSDPCHLWSWSVSWPVLRSFWEPDLFQTGR